MPLLAALSGAMSLGKVQELLEQARAELRGQHTTLRVTNPAGQEKVISVTDVTTIAEIVEQCTAEKGGEVTETLVRGTFSLMRVSLLTTQGDVTKPWKKKSARESPLRCFLVDRLFVIGA